VINIKGIQRNTDTINNIGLVKAFFFSFLVIIWSWRVDHDKARSIIHFDRYFA